MRMGIWWLCTVTLAICGSFLAASGTSANPQHRYAETSPAETDKRYRALKKEVKKSYRRHFFNVKDSGYSKNLGDVGLLRFYWAFLDPLPTFGPQRDHMLVSLAKYVVALEHVLLKEGYPPSVWRAQLELFEDRVLLHARSLSPAIQRVRACAVDENGMDADEFDLAMKRLPLEVPSVDERLATPLKFPEPDEDVAQVEEAISNCEMELDSQDGLLAELRPVMEMIRRYQAARGDALELITIEPPEIGGSQDYERLIKWDPPGGELKVIPKFWYDIYCLQNGRFVSTALCESKWRDIPSIFMRGGGEYYYVAVWPGGRQKCGLIAVTHKTAEWTLRPASGQQVGGVAAGLDAAQRPPCKLPGQ